MHRRPDYHPPETPMPVRFEGAAPGGSADVAQWWQSFGDPELVRVLAAERHDDGAEPAVAADLAPLPGSHLLLHLGIPVEVLESESDSDEAALTLARRAYVNYLGPSSADRIREIYGVNYPRLARIKARYDPANLFRSNQNVLPAARS